MTLTYTLLDLSTISLVPLTRYERELFERVDAEYHLKPPWVEFKMTWLVAVVEHYDRQNLPRIETVKAPLYRVVQDMGSRLMVAQGYARPPRSESKETAWPPSLKNNLEIARDIAGSIPLPAGWPEEGMGASPRPNWLTYLREAGWPVGSRETLVPKNRDSGGHRSHGTVPEPVSIVPETWLRELARRLGVKWSYACRFTVAAK